MKKKDFIWSMLAVVLASMLCTGFISCGDDDDDDSIVNPSENGNNNESNTYPPFELYCHLMDKSGKRVLLTGWASNYLKYNDKGQWIEYGVDDEPEYKIDGLHIYSIRKSEYGHTPDKEEYQLTLNNQGLITHMVHTLNEYDDNILAQTFKQEYDIKYNNKNQVITMTGTYEEEVFGWNDDSNYYNKFNAKSTLTCTWNNDNLVKVEMGLSDVTPLNDDGRRYIKQTKVIDTINYGNQANPTRQMPSAMRFDDLMFSMLGLYGQGPAYLPTEITHISENYYANSEEVDKRTNIHKFSYTLNDNATIATETIDSKDSYDYRYDNDTRLKTRGKFPEVYPSPSFLLGLNEILLCR